MIRSQMSRLRFAALDMTRTGLRPRPTPQDRLQLALPTNTNRTPAIFQRRAGGSIVRRVWNTGLGAFDPHIVTVEDPIEYYYPHKNRGHSQRPLRRPISWARPILSPKKNLTPI